MAIAGFSCFLRILSISLLLNSLPSCWTFWWRTGNLKSWKFLQVLWKQMAKYRLNLSVSVERVTARSYSSRWWPARASWQKPAPAQAAAWWAAGKGKEEEMMAKRWHQVGEGWAGNCPLPWGQGCEGDTTLLCSSWSFLSAVTVKLHRQHT